MDRGFWVGSGANRVSARLAPPQKEGAVLPTRRPDLAVEIEIGLRRAQVHGIGPGAELRRLGLVFDLEHCLTAVDERGFAVALRILEALLVHREIEQRL